MNVLEIKGKVCTAVCYAKVIEDEAVEQIRRMCDYEFTQGSRIRIMPDVHVGKGCTIGTTMTVHERAVPNIVGVDIGCGMYTVNLGNREIDMERLDEAAHFVPSEKMCGRGVRNISIWLHFAASEASGIASVLKEASAPWAAATTLSR